MDQAHVFNFFFQVARLTTYAETPKTGTPTTQCPTGDGNLKSPDFFDNLGHIKALALQHSFDEVQPGFMFRQLGLIVVFYLFVCDHGNVGYLNVW